MEENEEFEVEKIVAQRENHGCIEYKIRWKSYGADFDTWEPESNLIGCDQVLKNFKIQNNVENLYIKEDVEDGEVSQSDSSGSNFNESRKSKKSSKSKKKKSKRRNNPKNTSEIKTESYQDTITQTVNDDLGIKVEIAIDTHVKEKPVQPLFSPNFSLGASELLFSYSSIPLSNPTPMENSGICKEELQHKEEETVFIKEEKSYFDSIADQVECEDSDSGSDLDGQLTMVISDDICPAVVNECDVEPVVIAPVDLELQSDQNRSWRDHQGVFKIKKSQRKDGHGNFNVEETPTILAKDRWPMRVKDSQTEAFYNLPLVGSLTESRIKLEKDILVIKSTFTKLSKESLYKAVEEGNSLAVWCSYLCDISGALNDGDLLILASRFGYCDIIGVILKAGTDINFQSEDGVTPLMTAAEFGHESACQLLIDNGAFINTVNKKQESAITKAVSRGNTDCLLILLQHGCDAFNLDNEKGPLQIARQRNIHEMEVLISDYAQRMSDTLTQLFLTLTNSSMIVTYVLFPLRIVSPFESNEFIFEFNAKIPPVRDDECNLLGIFSGFIQDKQLKYCLDKNSNAVESVFVNDNCQQSLFPNGCSSITSMSPILDGKNVLKIKCSSIINCRWVRMLIIGFRIKIIEKQSV